MTRQKKAASQAGDETTVKVSSKVYCLEVLKKAAYRFLDRGIVTLTPRGESVDCVIRFSTPKNPEDAKRIADEFLAEIIDQDLRRIVGDETATIRNAVLAYAFSRTGLQDDG